MCSEDEKHPKMWGRDRIECGERWEKGNTRDKMCEWSRGGSGIGSERKNKGCIQRSRRM